MLGNTWRGVQRYGSPYRVDVLPGMQLLDVSGPLDVFAQANLEVNRQVYSLKVIACEAGPITSSSGARLLPDFVAGEPLSNLDTSLSLGHPMHRACISRPSCCPG